MFSEHSISTPLVEGVCHYIMRSIIFNYYATSCNVFLI